MMIRTKSMNPRLKKNWTSLKRKKPSLSNNKSLSRSNRKLLTRSISPLRKSKNPSSF
jgi:hypothetical protein